MGAEAVRLTHIGFIGKVYLESVWKWHWRSLFCMAGIIN